MNKFFIDSDIEEIVDKVAEEASKLSGKTIVLTGALGFLGRYFLEYFSALNEKFLAIPCKIVALDNLITGNKNYYINESNIHFRNVNVIEKFEYNDKVDIIIHAAGIASPFYYRAYPLETLDVAILGTRNFLEMAKMKKAKFIFFSSSEIYGDPDPNQIPIKESYRGNVATLGPRACYDESKRLGETLCYIYNTLYGVTTNIIRPFNVYGPGMQEQDYRLMPNFASLIKAKKPVQVYGTGDQTRTFCYVTDALTGFINTILKGVSGEAYNIGNTEPEVSVIDVLKCMEEVLGEKINYTITEHPESYPADEPQRRCPDINKAKKQLNFNPKIDLKEGLSRYLNWSDKMYIGNFENG